MINQKSRTLKLTRGEMNDIRGAITSVIYSVDDVSKKKWEALKEKIVSQLDAQDAKYSDKDYLDRYI